MAVQCKLGEDDLKILQYSDKTPPISNEARTLLICYFSSHNSLQTEKYSPDYTAKTKVKLYALNKASQAP